MPQTDQNKLISWYQKNKRDLPWRENGRKNERKNEREKERENERENKRNNKQKNNHKNPYFILVSELMLQQTTVQTVIPYYKKFIRKFKTIKSLAKASPDLVLSYWSGLGYYSRAKNLHKTAKIIAQKKTFPTTVEELLTLPGLGDYTARAISSFAFNNNTGVLDTNVIRVFTRYQGSSSSIKGLLKTDKKKLQKKLDVWVSQSPSAILNQALMELGALVCTPYKPACLICPLKTKCYSFKNDSIPEMQSQKIKKQIWIYKALICTKNNKIAFIKNHSLPVLKKYPMLVGSWSKSQKAPKYYDFKHSITRYTIYVTVKESKKTDKQQNGVYPINKASSFELIYISPSDIAKKNPSSLIKKILAVKKILL